MAMDRARAAMARWMAADCLCVLNPSPLILMRAPAATTMAAARPMTPARNHNAFDIRLSRPWLTRLAEEELPPHGTRGPARPAGSRFPGGCTAAAPWERDGRVFP